MEKHLETLTTLIKEEIGNDKTRNHLLSDAGRVFLDYTGKHKINLKDEEKLMDKLEERGLLSFGVGF